MPFSTNAIPRLFLNLRWGCVPHMLFWAHMGVCTSCAHMGLLFVRTCEFLVRNWYFLVRAGRAWSPPWTHEKGMGAQKKSLCTWGGLCVRMAFGVRIRGECRTFRVLHCPESTP
jgi:hypothetical protein